MRRYFDINNAFLDSLSEIDTNGNWLTIRGSKVKEILDYSFTITNPIHRVLTCRKRYNNILATVAETLWVFSGRNDMKFLTNFLPNATDYSDGKKLFWGGGYGPRLRHFHPNHNRFTLHDNGPQIKNEYIYQGPYGMEFYDQINNVIETLKEDPYSRQAVIIIPQANIDYDINIKTKDRPCTIFVQFIIRNNKLHCYTRFRSNDVLWGAFNINVFEWTFLQEVIASILNIEIGTYNHNAVSFHYYSNMETRIKNILSCEQYNIYSETGYNNKLTIENIYQFYKDIDLVMEYLEVLISGNKYLISKPETSLPLYLIDLPVCQILINQKKFEFAYFLLTNIFKDQSKESYFQSDNCYYIAALEYLFRILQKHDPELRSTLIERFTINFYEKIPSKAISFAIGRN